MDVELFNDQPCVDYRKPIKINMSKQECKAVYEYLRSIVKLLCLNDLTELMVFEKILEVLKKLTIRMQSYTKVRCLSISYTQAKAICYLYCNHAGPKDHLINLEFIKVFMQIDKQL